MKFVHLIALVFLLLGLVGCSKQVVPLEEAPVVQPDQVDNQPTEQEELVDLPEPESKYDLNTISITAHGTEPFWNFVASGSSLIWTAPSFTGPIVTETYTMSMSQTATTVTLAGSGINAILTLQTCSDGMSEIVYTHEAVITKGSDTFNGCANITP